MLSSAAPITTIRSAAPRRIRSAAFLRLATGLEPMSSDTGGYCSSLVAPPLYVVAKCCHGPLRVSSAGPHLTSAHRRCIPWRLAIQPAPSVLLVPHGPDEHAQVRVTAHERNRAILSAPHDRRGRCTH